MARSDGSFPEYNKIEIDREEWPNKYWDASRLCSACATNWPNLIFFSSCPSCKVKTEVDESNPPDMRWPDAVSAYLTGRFDRLYERYNEGRTDQELAFEEDKQKQDFDFKKDVEVVEHS